MGTIHVVGGGMAGLAAALAASKSGRSVILYEAAQHAGGRCRSFHDAYLDRDIDNGNHLLLTGNSAAAEFIRETGAEDRFDVPDQAAIPFRDLRNDEQWTVRPNAGVVPWWIFCPSRRVPGSRARDYLAALRLRRAAANDTIQALLGAETALYERFWEPVAVAALNTPASDAAARLLWPVFAETFGRGGRYARPRFARRGLSHALVDPALSVLKSRGARVLFGHRLKEFAIEDARITRLDFSSQVRPLGSDDAIVLATPAPQAAALLPGIPVPERFHAIVNVHYRLEVPLPERVRRPILGLIGSVAEWLFLRGDMASVTVSAADALAETDSEEIARRIWRDVAQVLEITAPIPKYRVIKEKRATFSQTPDCERRRPNSATIYSNLFLAGDWTNTGLPATIEGAIRSGFRAASHAIAE